MTMTASRTRRPRADAERNRERLLAAATRAFAQSAEAPLEDVARRAHVGIGTLYRHFPTRAALIEASYRHEAVRLCAPLAGTARTLRTNTSMRAWEARFFTHVSAPTRITPRLRPYLPRT